MSVADVGNIINSINNSQISTAFPKFDNENSKNPIEFLNEFDKYCIIKQINNENKIILILQCFTGKVRIWANSRSDIQTFDAFRAAFLDEFYSIPVRANRKKMAHQSLRSGKGLISKLLSKRIRIFYTKINAV